MEEPLLCTRRFAIEFPPSDHFARIKCISSARPRSRNRQSSVVETVFKDAECRFLTIWWPKRSPKWSKTYSLRRGKEVGWTEPVKREIGGHPQIRKRALAVKPEPLVRGWGEIRTRGELPLNGFQDRLFRPLRHPSNCASKGSCVHLAARVLS